VGLSDVLFAVKWLGSLLLLLLQAVAFAAKLPLH
jgi:hypothetical protein